MNEFAQFGHQAEEVDDMQFDSQVVGQGGRVTDPIGRPDERGDQHCKYAKLASAFHYAAYSDAQKIDTTRKKNASGNHTADTR